MSSPFVVAFVTSLRAKALARNWEYHVWMLEKAVASMLHQERGSVRVFIACHDVPRTDLQRDSRIEFVPVRFEPPARNNDDMCADKVLKISAGIERALAEGCHHVVFMDADDLVSNRIGELIEQNPRTHGWYSANTLFHSYGSRWLRFVSFSGMSSGPFAIFHKELLHFDLPPFSGPWTDLVHSSGESAYLDLLARHGEKVNTLAAAGLAHYRALASAEGKSLNPLPFVPMIMINHIESTSHVSGGLGSYDRGPQSHPSWRIFLSGLKRRIRWLPTLRWLSLSLRREFSVPSQSAIPAAYRSRGSLFWR